jgi:hypothetical protein
VVILVALQASKCSREVSSKIVTKTASARSSSVPSEAQKGWPNNTLYVPWWHPKFLTEKGCITYLRVDADDSIRKNIDRHSPEFKKLYKLRMSSERIFSLLLSIFMQYPTVKGLNATANFCTVAHITVLAVALTAVKIDQKDKIRYVKTLIPKLFLRNPM